jgi:predicted transcriptional regulator
MKNRSRADIVAEILKIAIGGGTSKTTIMYGAYLSYAQLKEYLTVMLENGLLEEVTHKMQYRTTAKGLGFLKNYEHVGKMVSASSK